MSRSGVATAPLSQSLAGTWELMSRQDRTLDGQLRIDPALGPDPVALLIYDRNGHFAAQFMKTDRGPGVEIGVAGAGPNNSRAIGGYDAYFGTYEVDDAEGTVTQCLLGALSPDNVGLVLTRAMSVQGDELVISLQTATAAGEAIVRTLRWRRVG
jgi:hypothetical protein